MLSRKLRWWRDDGNAVLGVPLSLHCYDSYTSRDHPVFGSLAEEPMLPDVVFVMPCSKRLWCFREVRNEEAKARFRVAYGCIRLLYIHIKLIVFCVCIYIRFDSELLYLRLFFNRD
jgi:hypothetical protein